ncbi:LptF/LptG family permease [Candidatus Pelagibacter sp.]|uniref:LptF/LptG family permease n=1 Tax=Candidatus Pelagibacter sp. TaxID=2024849 RepID=UPI003F8252E4
MKKILFRKILSDCLVFFLITLFSTGVIIWVFQAVNFLDIIVEDGRNYLVYLNFSLLNFPKVISKLVPFVLFFSFIYVIGKYELKNELIIFWNFGINKIDLINFFIKFSLLIMLFQMFLTAIIVPKSQDLARSFLRASSINYLENFIKPKIFNDAVKGLTIYSNSKDEFGNLNEIYLKKGSGDNFQITFAKEGRFKQIGNNQFLELNFGETISVINDKITNFKFKKTDFNLSNFEDNTTTYKKTQEVATLDLVKCYHKLMNFDFIKIDENFEVENCRTDNIDNIIRELYKRIIIPLYIPVLILISLMLIFRSKENINYSRYRILIFLIGFSTIILSEMTIRLIDKDFIKNIKFFIIPIFLVFTLYYNYVIRFKDKKIVK